MSSKSIIGTVIGVIVVIVIVVAIAHHSASTTVGSKNVPAGFPGSTGPTTTATQKTQPNNYNNLPPGVLPPGPPPGATVRFTR